VTAPPPRRPRWPDLALLAAGALAAWAAARWLPLPSDDPLRSTLVVLPAAVAALAAIGRAARRAGARSIPAPASAAELIATALLGAVAIARPRLGFALPPEAVFAGLALVLALGGIYGVLSYVVGQRVREIGIRVALGATRTGVVRLVLRHGLVLVAVGLGLGFAAAAAAGRVLETLLVGVSPHDPATFAGVAAVVGGAALLAALVPARRALRVDPGSVLRQE
jgi:putative ABC transport system permease protein